MKVLEVTDFYYPWIAGPAPFIYNLSRGLTENGHDVTVVAPSPTGRPYDEPGWPRVHRTRTVPVPFGYKVRAGMPLVDSSNLIRTWRPDVVHIHHPFPISASTALAARAAGIPIVATNHTIPECTLFGVAKSPFYDLAKRAFSLEIRAVLASAKVVTTPTETAARMLRTSGFKGDITVISNGVDTASFRPSPATGDALPVVLFTGRLDPDKDLEVLVRAVPKVLEQVECRVRIGGEGTDRARLETLVADMGLTDRIEFTDYVEMSELPKVYQGAALYAIPSTVELQSISTLEALASGLPVVGVDAGALPELIKDDVNGYLVPPGDSKQFADAIARILLDKAKSGEMAAASRRIAQSHSVGAMIAQYQDVLQETVMNSVKRRAYGATGN